MTKFETEDKERLDILAATRGRVATLLRKAAVRIEDLAGLLEMDHDLQSAPASSSPTQAEFNALVEDVARMHRSLVNVSDALANRLK